MPILDRKVWIEKHEIQTVISCYQCQVSYTMEYNANSASTRNTACSIESELE